MDALPGFESRPLPESFILELTRRCNNRCLYCYTAWGAPRLGYGRPSDGEMSTSDIKQVIARLQDEAAPKTIGLSGGEPLLRDDLPEIVAFIRSRGIAPIVISNGTLLTRDLAAAAARVDSVCEITLLSQRRAVHDQLAGRRGAWDGAVEGMTNLLQAGGNTLAVFVATRLNYMDLPKTAELAIALGAYGLMYNRLNLGAFNVGFADSLLPTPAMIRENLDMLEALGDKYGLPIVAAVVIEPCVVDVRHYSNIRFGSCPLAGERSYFTIDPAGNIRICNHSPTIVGNIWRDCFDEIYRRHPYVRHFRETWPIECADCATELRSLCGGGCKAAAEQCYGTLEHVDPFVTLSRQADHEIPEHYGMIMRDPPLSGPEHPSSS